MGLRDDVSINVAKCFVNVFYRHSKSRSISIPLPGSPPGVLIVGAMTRTLGRRIYLRISENVSWVTQSNRTYEIAVLFLHELLGFSPVAMLKSEVFRG